MKKTISLVLISVVLSSCGHAFKQIGYLNMVSTRNVSLKENYVNLKSYAGGDKRELNKRRGKTVDEAINNLVKSVPGGEFVQNAKVYTIDGEYYAVEGDIWGLEGHNFKGFKKGDRIMWQDGFVKYTGIIMDLNNDETATVRQDENGKMKTVNYSQMQKIE